jgi:uncharacterized protein (DUF302 family)
MRVCFVIIVIFIALTCLAGGQEDAIYVAKTQQSMDTVYPNLYKALEDSRFYVIFEANIGKNLARNAERWGEQYNRNKFEAVRSMVICNPEFANQVLNLDPEMMAMCPMTVTLLHKLGTTTILFERLTPVATGSAAEDIFWEVENTIISIIESVL